MGTGPVTDRPVAERPNGGAVDQDADSAPARFEREIADQLRLRPELPGVTRLSRKVLIGLGAVASIGIGGALVVALQGSEEDERPAELYNTDRVAQADGLGTLPRDYSGVPQLGPPLPGDLGRPMLSAQQRGEAVPTVPLPGAPGTPTPAPVDPAVQRAEQEREAARTSRLFNATETGAADAPGSIVPVPVPPPALPAPVPTTSSAPGRGEAFLARDADRQTQSSERLRAPLSPYVLQAGSIIPAALLTGLRSDLPGQVTAQVTAPVYDSPTGSLLLIPQGSRLIGQYDAEVGYGQERVLLVWNRLIMSDGRSIVLERQPGADAQGHAGLQDRVDNHWGRLIGAGLISTLLGVGAELGTDSDSDIARAIRDGVQESVGDAGQEIVRRQLDIRPTLTIRPGYPVRVIVTRDLILEPQGNGR
ncbi:conjugal transfer protein TraI [Brevundimonas sp. DS20]|nr:conjugal transfer protein TraI [Brevundimonas sp. DS20]